MAMSMTIKKEDLLVIVVLVHDHDHDVHHDRPCHWCDSDMVETQRRHNFAGFWFDIVSTQAFMCECKVALSQTS